MSPSATLILGVISGIAATVITTLTIAAFKYILLPKLKAMRYSGLDVSGKWHCKPIGLCQDIFLEINQEADDLSGTSILASRDASNADHEIIRTFQLNGFIRDGFVILTALHNRQNRLGVHSYVLRAVNDGRHLVGVMSHYSPRANEIMSQNLNFAHESCALAKTEDAF